MTSSGSVQALVLDLGAHHLDLMFMDDNDPPCATDARAVEAEAIARWADADRARRVVADGAARAKNTKAKH